jgi:hypothetical protein
MFSLKNSRAALLFVVLTMVINLALSATAFADNKRWRGRNRDKKAEKFINGHDARDGRFDGRGPKLNKRRGQWSDDDCCDDRRSRRGRR